MARRRDILHGAAAVVALTALPGCATQEQPSPAAPAPDPQQAQELRLIAAYDAALALADGTHSEVLREIRDAHIAHLSALGWSGPASELPSSFTPTVARLQRAERKAARDREVAARRAEDAERAQILALIAASEAQHAHRLGAL